MRVVKKGGGVGAGAADEPVGDAALAAACIEINYGQNKASSGYAAPGIGKSFRLWHWAQASSNHPRIPDGIQLLGRQLSRHRSFVKYVSCFCVCLSYPCHSLNRRRHVKGYALRLRDPKDISAPCYTSKWET